MIKIVFIRGKLPYYYNAYDSNTTTFIAILFLLLSSPLPEFTEAQSDDGRPSPDAEPNPPSPFTGVTFLAFTGIIVFLMFIFYYFRESCIRRSTDISSAGIRATLGSSSQRRRGLDPAVLNTFPVYNYAEVKDLKEVVKKGQLECAVCLSAFEDDETLRLLPKCDHVFHPQCVDVWLESHTTCPYCRADLVPKPDDDDKSNPRISILMAEYENNISGGGACSCDGGGIEIQSDDTVLRLEEGTGASASGGGGTGWGSHSNNNFWRRSFQFRRFRSFGKLNRWNSTGHVADRQGKDSERFTLRLPPELLIGLGVNQKQDEVVVLHRTRSCL